MPLNSGTMTTRFRNVPQEMCDQVEKLRMLPFLREMILVLHDHFFGLSVTVTICLSGKATLLLTAQGAQWPILFDHTSIVRGWWSR